MTDHLSEKDDFEAGVSPLERYPCPQCGATMGYDPARGALSCGHCGHTRNVDPDPSSDHLLERDYVAAIRGGVQAMAVEDAAILSCDSCGAATRLDPDDQATICPFCASPLVGAVGARRRFKPQAVLPFAISRREARDRLKDWLAAIWFAPNDLPLDARRGDQFDGVYLPFWTFDADTRSRYRGARGDAYYVDRWVTIRENGRSVRRKKRQRKIRWTNVSGRVARFFDDVTVPGSRALPEKFARRLREHAWDLHALAPFSPDYLAGFRAELYSIDLEGAHAEARAVMDLGIRRDVRMDIGGDAQRITTVDTEYRDVTFKHVLLPIWIAAYRYRGRPYRFVVNGRTGEVIGERPYSWWKIAIAALAVAAVLGGVFSFLAVSGALSP